MWLLRCVGSLIHGNVETRDAQTRSRIGVVFVAESCRNSSHNGALTFASCSLPLLCGRILLLFGTACLRTAPASATAAAAASSKLLSPYPPPSARCFVSDEIYSLLKFLPLCYSSFFFSPPPAPAAVAAEARAAAAANGAGPAPTRAPVGLKAPTGKWSKSKKLQAGAFQGSGNKLA